MKVRDGLERISGAARLPSPPLIWGSPLVVFLLLFLEEMGLALEREANALDTRGQEADDYSEL